MLEALGGVALGARAAWLVKLGGFVSVHRQLEALDRLAEEALVEQHLRGRDGVKPRLRARAAATARARLVPLGALLVPHLEVGAHLRVDGVGALVERGGDQAEADVLREHRVLGQVATVLLKVHLAVLFGARVRAIQVEDVLHLVRYLARPVDLVLADVHMLAQRRGAA